MNLTRVIELFKALDREGVHYVLVGGVALNVHGIDRATRDVDLFVWPRAENVDRLKRAFRSLWKDPAIDEINEEDLRKFSTIRYGTPEEDMVVDLIAKLGTAFQYEDLIAQKVEWEGVTVCVATPQMIYRMKKDTIRPRDKFDAAMLKERFRISEE